MPQVSPRKWKNKLYFHQNMGI